MTIIQSSAANQNSRKNALRLAVAPLALAIGLGQVVPAYATIDNTVTVTGTSPSAATITDIDTENVAPVPAAPGITVNKAHTFTDTGSVGAEVGDVITYTYTVTNSGNTYLENVSISDVEDGTGALTGPVFAAVPLTDANLITPSTDDTLDNNWDFLAPGDSVNFTATYTVQSGDVSGNGAGNGAIDNTVTATGDYNDGTVITPQTATDTVSVLLYINSSLLVTKTADDTTDVVAGQLITYTYVVSNNGNVPITSITLSDTHKGVLNALTPNFVSLTNTSTLSVNTGADNTIESLYPGDSATFTATYTVLQSDIDTLQ